MKFLLLKATCEVQETKCMLSWRLGPLVFECSGCRRRGESGAGEIVPLCRSRRHPVLPHVDLFKSQGSEQSTRDSLQGEALGVQLDLCGVRGQSRSCWRVPQCTSAGDVLAAHYRTWHETSTCAFLLFAHRMQAYSQHCTPVGSSKPLGARQLPAAWVWHSLAVCKIHRSCTK